MAVKRSRIAIRSIAAAVCVLGALAPQAGAALPLQGLLQPKPVPVIAPVAEPITVDPAGPVRGTMILVHAGGWAGHDGHAQRLLVDNPGAMLVERGWRIISLDYNEGTAGLQDVLDATGAERARKTGDGPLCVYGESAGAHLALVAASRLRAIDCVAGLGTPTDLPLYQDESAASLDNRIKLVAFQMTRFFGATPDQFASWNPVTLAASIRADVLLVHEGDDTVVSAEHARRYQAASPTTQHEELEAGDPGDPATTFIHGTISAAGRAHYSAALGAFADRAVAHRQAERDAAQTGCAQVSRTVSEVGLPALQSALRCLARRSPQARSGAAARWRRTTVNLRGEVNAARIWSSLRSKTAGRVALAAVAKRRAKLAVRPGARTLVTVRATRAKT